MINIIRSSLHSPNNPETSLKHPKEALDVFLQQFLTLLINQLLLSNRSVIPICENTPRRGGAIEKHIRHPFTEYNIDLVLIWKLHSPVSVEHINEQRTNSDHISLSASSSEPVLNTGSCHMYYV